MERVNPQTPSHLENSFNAKIERHFTHTEPDVLAQFLLDKRNLCGFTLEDVKGERVQQYRDTSGISPEEYRRVLDICDREYSEKV